MAITVIGILIVIVAVAAERIVEMFASPVLEKYDISSKGVRTGIMVLLATLVNFALMAGLDLDPVSTLLEQNQSYYNMAIAAFTASGLSGLSHGLQQFLGKKETIIEVLEAGLEVAKDLEE